MSAILSALVIDDNSEALNAIGQVLAVAGVRSVCPAHSAEKALEILKTRRFNLIISDYRLEGMDGVEFLETLRAAGDRTPLLLLSGAPDKAGVIRAVSQPNVDVFGKPFRVAEFVDAINKLMNDAEVRRGY
jgi:CheY-like chemotaxis protein